MADNRRTQILNIPMLTRDNLFDVDTTIQKNFNGIDDWTIRQRLEIDYTTQNKDAAFYKFNRYLKKFPDDELTTLVPYVFLVRPDLNILNSSLDNYANDTISGDPTIRWLFNNCPDTIRSLSTHFSSNHDYIPYLCNRVETFPTFDFSLKVNDVTQAFTGYKSFYAGNAIESTTGIQFDITFSEDKNLNTLKLFFAWTYYIDGIMRNKFIPKDVYRFNRIADYYTSIYYFLCKPDAQEIVYFQKIVGAFPTNAPMSLLSMNLPMTPDTKVNISFSAFYVEQLNPVILSEFNYNSRMNYNGNWSRDPYIRPLNPVPHYETDIMSGRTFVGTPYVYSDDGKTYYLLWNEE